MKKSHFVVLFVCLSFLFISSASAEMYVGIKGGYAMVGDTDISIPGEAANGEEPPVETVGISDINFTEGYSGELSFDGGWILGVAIGTSMESYRLEGEFEYRSSDVEAEGISGNDTLKTLSLMLNGYYDFQTDATITPYIGAGIGFAKHDIVDEDDTVFAYQATIGAAWAVSATMDLDFAYRYFATADPDFGGVELDYDSHNFTVGIRFKI